MPERPETFTGFKPPTNTGAFEDHGPHQRHAMQTAIDNDEATVGFRVALDQSIPPGIVTGEDAVVYFMKGEGC